MGIEKSSDGVGFGSLKFNQGRPPRKKAQSDVSFHADSAEELDGQGKVLFESGNQLQFGLGCQIQQIATIAAVLVEFAF